MRTSWACRICDASSYDTVLEFGDVALADAFLARPDVQEDKYPLNLVICRECLHLQIRERVDRKVLFEDYPWETGIPASIHAYCREFVKDVAALTGLGRGQRVVEVASNDGTMLLEFQRQGFVVKGVDPAKNIVAKAVARGVETFNGFFDATVAQNLVREDGPADLCVARNVIAHVEDLQGLVRGFRTILRDSGTLVIEFPYLIPMFEQLQYDQVFHEHIGFHSLDSIVRLFSRHDLQVTRAEHHWVHGGSLRVFARPASGKHAVDASVREVLDQEERSGILTLEAWKRFGEKCHAQRRALVQHLRELRSRGVRVVGYGASGKGQTMIQFCQLTPEDIPVIADKSALKVGKFTPGSHIPICSVDEMRERKPEVIVLFAWNFAQEIVQQEKALREKGCRFLHPIPLPHYLDEVT
jgi:SAM-dependent methyltransferase